MSQSLGNSIRLRLKEVLTLENLNDDEDVNMTWVNINGNMQISEEKILGQHELKQNKLWFDEEYLCFLEQRKRAKMRWMQDPSQSNVDILNNVRREVSTHFGGKKGKSVS